MYKYIPRFDEDQAGEKELYELGLGGMVAEALKFCQPEWYGLEARATPEQIAELSLFVRLVEERGNELMMAEAGDDFSPGFGLPILLLSYLSDRDAYEYLPDPFVGCLDLSQERTMLEPIVPMLLGAQALGQLDEAISLLKDNRATQSVKHIARASESISMASGLASYIECERDARTSETRRKAHISAKGGRARGDRYREVREWVIEQFKGNLWSSPRQAAKALAPEALELSKAKERDLSEDRVFDTVYEWIRDELKRSAS
ncbi:hypothetical protein PQR67_03465 [Paraburkholderia fungorum]|uniref:hypothetical protein n=1 Tax=Paraburkholderia fungorum TaxID=134537 RepID=UPI0038B6ED9B